MHKQQKKDASRKRTKKHICMYKQTPLAAAASLAECLAAGRDCRRS